MIPHRFTQIFQTSDVTRDLLLPIIQPDRGWNSHGKTEVTANSAENFLIKMEWWYKLIWHYWTRMAVYTNRQSQYNFNMPADGFTLQRHQRIYR